MTHAARSDPVPTPTHAELGLVDRKRFFRCCGLGDLHRQKEKGRGEETTPFIRGNRLGRFPRVLGDTTGGGMKPAPRENNMRSRQRRRTGWVECAPLA